MKDVGHELLLSPVLFSHFSDISASTTADVHCKVCIWISWKGCGTGYSRI